MRNMGLQIIVCLLLCVAAAPIAAGQVYTYTGQQDAMNQAQAPVLDYDTVEWNITGGYFGTSGARNQTYSNASLIFTNVAQNNGWGEAVTRFASETTVTGAGAFSLTNAGLGQDYVFAGNMQGYSGDVNIASFGNDILDLGNTASSVVQYGGEASGGNVALGSITSDSSGDLIDNVAGTGSMTINNVVFNYGIDESYDYVQITNDIEQRQSVNFVGDSSVVASGVISGEGVLRKSGSGSLLLSGANTFAGNVLVQDGVLKFGIAGAGGAAGYNASGPAGENRGDTDKIQISSGATLDVNGFGNTRYGFTIAGTGTAGQGALINTGGDIGTNLVQTPYIRLSGDAAIGGTGNFNMIESQYAPNTLTLDGNTLTKIGSNDFNLINTTITAGTVRVSEGTFSISNAASDGSAAAFVLDDTAGVGLQLNNQNLSAGSLSGGGASGGNVGLGTGTVTIGALGADTTYSGVISGEGSVTVNGGTLALAGTNTYTGGTSVAAGTLNVDGSVASQVTAQSGATVGGIGTISGGLSMLEGSTLSPGNSPGDLAIEGNLALDGSDLLIDIVSETAYSSISISGGELSLANSPTITVDLGGNDFDLDTEFTIITGIGIGVDATWEPGDWGAITVTNTHENWGSKTFAVGEGSVMLKVIPEPSTLGILLLAGLVTIIRRLRLRGV